MQIPVVASSHAPPPHVDGAGACRPRLGVCRLVRQPVRVSGAEIGQSPEVVWDGHEAIITFQIPKKGVGIAAVSPDARVAWTDVLPGAGYGHVAWNARAELGLVVNGERVYWLGRGGKPTGTPAPVPHVVNVGFDGRPFATDAGFVVVSGVGGRASNATPLPLSVALLRSPSDALDWKQVDDDGDRDAPVGGLAPNGTTDWIASQPHHGHGIAQLYPVRASGDLGAALPIPLAAGTRVVALGEAPGGPFVVIDDTTHELVVARVRDGVVQAAEKLGVHSRRSGSADVVVLGGQLLIGADQIAGSPGVALAPLELGPPPTVGAAFAIGPSGSQHLRVAVTDRGFVAAWNIADDDSPLFGLVSGRPFHGLSTIIAVYDCCSAR